MDTWDVADVGDVTILYHGDGTGGLHQEALGRESRYQMYRLECTTIPYYTMASAQIVRNYDNRALAKLHHHFYQARLRTVVTEVVTSGQGEDARSPVDLIFERRDKN